jgi:hypothetical protein
VFNGVPEIAFQNNNGTPAIWLMNGTTPAAEAVLTNPGPGWQVISVDMSANVRLHQTGGPILQRRPPARQTKKNPAGNAGGVGTWGAAETRRGAEGDRQGQPAPTT